MTIEQLRNFIVVGRFLNIAKAAEYLYISHSSLSRHISSLESSLGVQLLIRDNRSVRLTKAGEFVLLHGPELLKSIDAFRNDVRHSGSENQGKLQICMPNFSSDSLFSCFHTFQERYPDIDLSLNYVGVDNVSEQVLQGMADVGITYSYQVPDRNPYLEITKLYNERFCLVVSERHALATRSAITVEELPDDELETTEAGLKSWLISANGSLSNTAVETPKAGNALSLDALFLRVKAGLRIAIVPRSLAKEYGSSCHVLDITDTNGDLSVVLLALKKRTNLATDLLLNLITEQDFICRD